MSQQLGALTHRLTAGEHRRRLAKIARRRSRGVVPNAVAERRSVRVDVLRRRVRRPWFGYSALRKARQAAKDAVGDFVSKIIARRELITALTFSAPRCPWKNVRRTVSGDVAGPDAVKAEAMPSCGGRLRKLPMPKEATTQHWRCRSCYRAWENLREPQRGFGGWVEVWR